LSLYSWKALIFPLPAPCPTGGKGAPTHISFGARPQRWSPAELVHGAAQPSRPFPELGSKLGHGAAQLYLERCPILAMELGLAWLPVFGHRALRPSSKCRRLSSAMGEMWRERERRERCIRETEGDKRCVSTSCGERRTEKHHERIC